MRRIACPDFLGKQSRKQHLLLIKISCFLAINFPNFMDNRIVCEVSRHLHSGTIIVLFKWMLRRAGDIHHFETLKTKRVLIIYRCYIELTSSNREPPNIGPARSVMWEAQSVPFGANPSSQLYVVIYFSKGCIDLKTPFAEQKLNTPFSLIK